MGALSVARLIYQTIFVLLQTFVISGQNVSLGLCYMCKTCLTIRQLKKFGAKKGAWAVVTGASDGIGKEFAFQLAKAGFNVLLVARNKTLLQATASDIGMPPELFILDP